MGAVCGCDTNRLLARAISRHHARLVYLYREDAVAVALSKAIAKRTKTYVLPPRPHHPRQQGSEQAGPGETMAGGSSNAPTVTARATPRAPAANLSFVIHDVDAFAEEALWFERHLRTFSYFIERLGQRSGVRLLTISYEELLSAPAAHARRLFDFLDLPPCEISLARATTRIGGRPLHQTVTNAREVCAALSARGLQASASWRASCGAPPSEGATSI